MHDFYCLELYVLESIQTGTHLTMKVIVTGGFFPITYMRNDIVQNLIESFAVISLAESKFDKYLDFNDVIIISKNKGFRANRSIKMKEGSLGSIASPNLEALVSINTKLSNNLVK